MAKTGAKPKFNVPRYQGGQIVHSAREPKRETPEQVRAVALAQPHRRGNGSQYAGYAYGRLFLGGQISERQMVAADIFTKRAVRHMAQITGTLPRFPSSLANMIKLDLEAQKEQEREKPAEDFSIKDEQQDDEDRIAAIRDDYDEIQTALADAGMHFTGNTILTRVCVLDREPTNEGEMGAFRCALNAVAKRLRLA